MDRSVVITLVTETYTMNDYGVYESTETTRDVYADVTSVTASEWFEGGRNGLNPEYRMRIFKYDYENEEIVEYNGVRYTVYRTYEARNDILELYVEKKKGKE